MRATERCARSRAPAGERAPLGQRVGGALGLQRATGLRQRPRPSRLEQGLERVEVVAHLRGQRGLQRGEVEQVDVEVAQLAGDRLDALELLAEVLEALGVDRLELALERARAAHGDAQVVQELRVDVLDRAREVVVDHLEQAGEHGRGGRARGLLGIEREVELGARPRGRSAGGGDRLVDQRDRRLGQAERVGEQGVDALELPVVAAHGGRGHAPAQTLVGLDVEPDHRLLVGVEHAERDLARAHPRHRHQRAHLDHVGEVVVEVVGEVAVEQAVLRTRGRRARRERLAGRALGQRQLPAAVAQREPRLVQAAVEGVVERAGARPDAAGGHVDVFLEECARVGELRAFGQQMDHPGATLEGSGPSVQWRAAAHARRLEYLERAQAMGGLLGQRERDAHRLRQFLGGEGLLEDRDQRARVRRAGQLDPCRISVRRRSPGSRR